MKLASSIVGCPLLNPVTSGQRSIAAVRLSSSLPRGGLLIGSPQVVAQALHRARAQGKVGRRHGRPGQ